MSLERRGMRFSGGDKSIKRKDECGEKRGSWLAWNKRLHWQGRAGDRPDKLYGPETVALTAHRTALV